MERPDNMGKNINNRKQPGRLPVLPLAAAVILMIGVGILWLDFRLGITGGAVSATPSPTAASPNLVPVVPQESIQLSPLSGKPAPDFSLQTPDGQVVRLSDYRGKAVLINLWATWCPPCQAEMPAIQAAYEKYKDRGLVVLGIDFTAQDNLPDVVAFVSQFNLTFPVLLDEDGSISSVSYGMRGLPDSYFIDPAGVVRRIVTGAIPSDKLDQFIEEIIPQPGPA
jgi:peroxiredoxin